MESGIADMDGDDMDGIWDMDEEWRIWVAGVVDKGNGFGGFGYV